MQNCFRGHAQRLCPTVQQRADDCRAICLAPKALLKKCLHRAQQTAQERIAALLHRTAPAKPVGPVQHKRPAAQAFGVERGQQDSRAALEAVDDIKTLPPQPADPPQPVPGVPAGAQRTGEEVRRFHQRHAFHLADGEVQSARFGRRQQRDRMAPPDEFLAQIERAPVGAFVHLIQTEKENLHSQPSPSPRQ